MKIDPEVWGQITEGAPRPWSEQAVATDLEYYVHLTSGPSVGKLSQRWGWEPRRAVDFVRTNAKAAEILMNEKPAKAPKAPPKRKKKTRKAEASLNA